MVMDRFFFWSGVLVWIALTPFLLAVLFFVLSYWHHEVFLPSIGNLRFALFGKPRSEDRSYYELWRLQRPGSYRFYTRGYGNRYFRRCYLRRLVGEARRESLRVRDDDEGSLRA